MNLTIKAAVHWRGPKGKPACGYRRWISQIITTNGDKSKVTCKRRGCAVDRCGGQ